MNTYYLNHREEIIGKVKKYQSEHPEVNKRATAKYRMKNREKENLRTLEYRTRNREHYRELGRLYRLTENGRERHCIHEMDRRVRKLINGGKFTLEEWIEMKKQYENKCLGCGNSEVKLTIDHVIPLIKGGEHNVDNIQPLCFQCNNRKRISIIDYRRRVVA